MLSSYAKLHPNTIPYHTIPNAGKVYTAPHIMIATGGRPRHLTVPGGELAINSGIVRHLC